MVATSITLSYEVNRAAQRSSAPTVADDRALNAISLKAQRSSENTLRHPRGVINVSSAQLVTYGDASFANMEGSKSQCGVIVFLTHEPDVFGMVNSSSDIWFTGRAAQSVASVCRGCESSSNQLYDLRQLAIVLGDGLLLDTSNQQHRLLLANQVMVVSPCSPLPCTFSCRDISGRTTSRTAHKP